MVLCIQANPSRSHAQLQLPQLHPRLHKSCTSQAPRVVLRPAAKYLSGAPLLKLQPYSLAAKYLRRSHVCLLGGNENSEGENGGSPLKSLGNAVGSFEGKSLEDVLKEQMNNQEFDQGGIGGLPPIDGSGGGDGGGDDPQGPPDDEDLPGMLDETLQMVLASVGFVLAYRYILDGEGMMKIVKDYFKFLFTGYKSVRLRRLFEELETWWHEICKTAGPRKMVYKDKFWLEREIMNNTTWFDHPDKYMRYYRSIAPAKKVRKLLKRRLRGRGRGRRKIFIDYFDNNIYYDNY